MQTYRIHRLKEHLRQQVRFAPHVSGIATVKPRDYQLPPPGEEAAEVSFEAASPYAAFFALRDAGTPLEVGDLLEAENGSMRIFKFVGFEEAQWVVPEPKPPAEIQEQSAALQ
ncbi:MAG TPA: hypothetical protein VGJ09_18805 [Bryobacteraceae bacterium]